MFKNYRDLLSVFYLCFFALWMVVVVFFVLPWVTCSPESVDPMMAMVAGLGIGGVTQFFIVIGTIVFQFYFRKKETEVSG